MRLLPFLVLFMWLLAMSASYNAFITPAVGTGTRFDSARFGEIVGWQIMATVMAVFQWRLGRQLRKRSPMRAISVIPLLIAIGLALYALGLIAQALLLGV